MYMFPSPADTTDWVT